NPRGRTANRTGRAYARKVKTDPSRATTQVSRACSASHFGGDTDRVHAWFPERGHINPLGVRRASRSILQTRNSGRRSGERKRLALRCLGSGQASHTALDQLRRGLVPNTNKIGT